MKDEHTEEDLLKTIYEIDRRCYMARRKWDDAEREMRATYRELDEARSNARSNLRVYRAKQEARA